MTFLCIWRLGKRSLEHSPTQQGEFWALEQDSPVFTHASLQYVLIHTRWHPWFLQSLQLFSEQTCSAQTFTGWGVGHPTPSHHKHKVEKLHKDNWLSSSILCFSCSSSCPQHLHFSVCNTLIKPLPDHELERMLWWGKNIDVPWHHTKVQCHGSNLMTREIITNAGSIYIHLSPFHRWRGAWGGAKQLGRLQEVLVFPALAGWWEKQHPWEEPCWDSATRLQPVDSTSLSITQPRWSLLLLKTQLKSNHSEVWAALGSQLGLPWLP